MAPSPQSHTYAKRATRPRTATRQRERACRRRQPNGRSRVAGDSALNAGIEAGVRAPISPGWPFLDRGSGASVLGVPQQLSYGSRTESTSARGDAADAERLDVLRLDLAAGPRDVPRYQHSAPADAATRRVHEFAARTRRVAPSVCRGDRLRSRNPYDNLLRTPNDAPEAPIENASPVKSCAETRASIPAFISAVTSDARSTIGLPPAAARSRCRVAVPGV